MLLLLALLGSGGSGPAPAAGQAAADTSRTAKEVTLRDRMEDPPDTYRSPAAASVIERARAARTRGIDDISHYEARLRQRAYVGFRGVGFRRERGVVEEERVGQIRWEQEGERTVAWIGGRRDIPILTGLGDAEHEMGEELARDLLRSGDAGPLLSDPWDDRLALGGNWALHPLADSAGHFYRYGLGDTLRIGLPDGRTVTLLEVRVEPREALFSLVAGSLWFDEDQGGLVRATYRPARPFDLDLDEPDDASDVPGLLKPIRAEIRYITVDYSFHELRWWLPRRWAFEGEAQLGRVARFPITLEWMLEDYAVNEVASAIPGGGSLPAGWSRRQQEITRDGEPSRYVTILVPSVDSLVASRELPPATANPAPTAFSEEEIRELRGRLDGLLPRGVRTPPTFGWGLEEGLVRYNRVEGLSVGARSTVPLSPSTRLVGEVRMGWADAEPNGELGLERGSEEGRGHALRVYRRLESSSDWGDAHSLGASLAAGIWGGDSAPFHRTLGAELVSERAGRVVRGSVRVFAERHGAVEKNTDFHLFKPVTGDTMFLAAPVWEGDVAGVGVDGRWQRGRDPAGLIASGLVGGEVVVGSARWQRLRGSAALVHPVPGGLSGALEVSAGTAWGEVPPQRRFFLGGAGTVRGFDDGELPGESFWFSRLELATALPAFRVALFGDLGWSGDRRDFGEVSPVAAAGIGLSLLDGIFRADLARILRGGSGTRLHLYLDGLF